MTATDRNKAKRIINMSAANTLDAKNVGAAGGDHIFSRRFLLVRFLCRDKENEQNREEITNYELNN